MVTRVILPKLAANVEEATVGQWFKQEGERVEAGELLFEAITDKAAVEVKAEGSGVLRKVYATENSVVPVGQLIGVIAEPDEEIPEPEAVEAEAPEGVETRVKASFGARRLAKQLGVDLPSVAPTRPDGRVSEEDVRRAAAQVAGPAVLERIPHSPMKRALAQHLTHTVRTVAASFVMMDVDFSAVQVALPRLSDEAGTAVQPRDVLVHVAASLLPEHRLLNACYTDEAVLVYEPVHVGLAFDVARDDGVLVPVLRDANATPLAELAQEAAALSERLAAHELGPADFADATFTVTDQSALGIDGFVPILNDKQSAILALSSIRERPVVRDGQLAVAPVAALAVAFDHRVLNGTTAARFLKAVKQAIEEYGAPNPKSQIANKHQ